MFLITDVERRHELMFDDASVPSHFWDGKPPQCGRCGLELDFDGNAMLHTGRTGTYVECHGCGDKIDLVEE